MYWYIFLALLGLVLLLILYFLLKFVKGILGGILAGGGERATGKRIESGLEEDLSEYPLPRPSTGDRQLRIEGVPCRLRLIALAPAGKADEIDEDQIPKMLNQIVPGLGDIFLADKPRVRIWPVQISYEGFAKHFHRNTKKPEEEDEPTPWVIVAGRVKIAKQQVMLGIAALAAKPTTVSRQTYDSHQWATSVKVRVRDV